MLELFTSNDARFIESQIHEFPELREFITLYIADQNRHITPLTLTAMLKYNGITPHGLEIGEIMRLGIHSLKSSRGVVHCTVDKPIATLQSVWLLLSTYKKLQTELRHKNQYHILELCFMFLSPHDVGIFARLLCGEIQVSDTIKQVVDMQYRIICKGCNALHSYSETPVSPNMPTKCPSCGKERLAVEALRGERAVQTEYDVFIVNKRTGATKHNGFILMPSDIEGKTTQAIRDSFIEKVAHALGGIVTPEGMSVLLKP